jgi:nucleotide-binding universal stress UspA family protein
MIKDIIVNLSVPKPKDVAADFAISVASLFQAHLSAVAFAYTAPVAAMGEGFPTPSLDDWEAERRAEAEQTQRAFEHRAGLAGVTFDSRIVSDDVEGAAVAFGEIARNYDLSVVAQSDPEDTLPQDLLIEAALFDSGRPLLVVPYIQSKGIALERVMVCWDGSRNAARAVGDALPLLTRARHVDVVTVEQREQRKEVRGAQIADHLARHKIAVDVKAIVAQDNDAASIILSQAADSDTDLIVMGAYGHTRLREFILGGATRDILSSMTVPVLMSH